MAVDRREEAEHVAWPLQAAPIPDRPPGRPGPVAPNKRTGARAEADASRDSARPAMAHAHARRGRGSSFLSFHPLNCWTPPDLPRCIVASPAPKHLPRVSPPQIHQFVWSFGPPFPSSPFQSAAGWAIPSVRFESSWIPSSKASDHPSLPFPSLPFRAHHRDLFRWIFAVAVGLRLRGSGWNLRGSDQARAGGSH
jgi:hypothetical protein